MGLYIFISLKAEKLHQILKKQPKAQYQMLNGILTIHERNNELKLIVMN
jgi:hypothetical protein